MAPAAVRLSLNERPLEELAVPAHVTERVDVGDREAVVDEIEAIEHDVARSRADGNVTLYMIAGCGPMSRASETVRPVRTSEAAWARLAGVIRLTVPR